MESSPSNHYYSILKQLQAVDFVLLDLSLYLDTHTDDGEALRQFNHYALERKKLVDFYERNYGPLIQLSPTTNRSNWEWNNSPWPWQI